MSDTQIAIIILAAGTSSRLGRPKQLLEYHGRSLINIAASSAIDAKIGPTIIVTSPRLQDAIRENIQSEKVQTVINTGWETGMSSSIRTGLSYAMKALPDLEAAIIALCDQPNVTSDTFLRLATSYRKTGSPIVASEYENTVGVPRSLIGQCRSFIRS